MAHIDDPRTQTANMAFIRQSMKEPLLEKEQEQKLARLWTDQRDEKALHTLVKAHTRLAVAIASKFRNYGLPLGDLIQEGNIGLMQAAERFDPNREVRFSTYATWWIRAAIQDYILRNWSIVRTGTTSAQKSLFFNFRRLRTQIERASGDALDDSGRKKIAQDLDVGLKDVAAMEMRFAGGDRSLNAKIGENGEDEWQDFLTDEAPNPEEIVIGMRDSKTRSEWLHQALKGLTDRERTIISERHLSQETVTLDDLGKTLGISKERVRQLEQRAMDKLKTTLKDRVGEGAVFG